MNWKKQFKKYFVQQMVLPALLLCLLGAVPASGTYCLLNNTTSVLTNTFDTYQSPYMVTYHPNGGYWVNTPDDVSIAAATETQYGHPTNTYTFNLLTQGKTVQVTFDGTSNNPSEYKLVYKGYELAGWSTSPQSPMNRSELAAFKKNYPNSFFDTTVDFQAWSITQTVTTKELYAVWVENAYTLVNGIGMNNALRGNLSEAKIDAGHGGTYYLPSSTVSLENTNSSNNGAGRDSTITHVIFSVGKETGAITLPTTSGTGTHKITNVTEDEIKAQGYQPIYLDSNQQGYIRMYRVYHDASTDAISPAGTATTVCVAYVFASSPETGFVPDAILANRNCAYMFYGLTGLIKVGGITNNVDFSTTTSMANMYAVCINLRWQDMADYEAGNNPYINVNFVLGNVQTMQGMFMGCSSAKNISFAKSNDKYVADFQGIKHYGTTWGNLTDLSHLFEGCTSLAKPRFVNAVGGEGKPVQGDQFDTSKVTTFANMFLGCRTIDSIDIQYIEVGSTCTSLENMFNGCSALKYLPTFLTNTYVDTSGVESFKGMYAGCTVIGTAAQGGTVLDLSNFTISNKAKDLSYMFAGCTSITGITLGDGTHAIDTQNVTNFSYMFMGCTSLTSFSQAGDGTGVAVFDTRNANTLEGMFMGCSRLTTANIGNWNVDKVENFSNMFANCSALTEVDSSSWQMGGSQAAGIDISGAFMGCANLKTVYVSATFQNSVSNSKIVNSDMLFFGCMSLQGNLGTKADGITHKYTTYTEVMNSSQHSNESWIRNYGLTSDSMALFTDKSVTVPTTTS